MKGLKCFLIFPIFIFISVGILLPQSQEEKSKKEEVITNQTLKKLKGKISILGSEEVKEEKTESEESAKEEVKDEKYWRNLKKEIERRIAQASERVENLKKEISDLYRDFYSIDDPARRDQIQVKIVENTRKLEEAEGELEKAKKELEEFFERARKEGALPGWLR